MNGERPKVGQEKSEDDDILYKDGQMGAWNIFHNQDNDKDGDENAKN